MSRQMREECPIWRVRVTTTSPDGKVVTSYYGPYISKAAAKGQKTLEVSWRKKHPVYKAWDIEAEAEHLIGDWVPSNV